MEATFFGRRSSALCGSPSSWRWRAASGCCTASSTPWTAVHLYSRHTRGHGSPRSTWRASPAASPLPAICIGLHHDPVQRRQSDSGDGSATILRSDIGLGFGPEDLDLGVFLLLKIIFLYRRSSRHQRYNFFMLIHDNQH
jgi:hypothetical protein